MEWHHTTSHRKKKFKAIPSASKVMATVVWDCEGMILIDVLPRSQKINLHVYAETPKKLFRRVSPHRDMTNVLLHHDNARPHKVCIPERPSQSFSVLSCLIHLTARIWLLPTTIC
jgi:hypothetical protein